MSFFGFIKHCFQYKSSPPVIKSPPKMLHGFDLSIWEYIGYSDIKYIDTEGNTTSSCCVFCFCRKNDYSIRDYKLQYTSFKYHTWVLKEADLWKANLRELYSCINKEPSVFLKKYMEEKYKNWWNPETNWWTNEENAKYQHAKKEQQSNFKTKNSPLTDIKEEGNIVTVNFDKEKKV